MRITNPIEPLVIGIGLVLVGIMVIQKLTEPQYPTYICEGAVIKGTCRKTPQEYCKHRSDPERYETCIGASKFLFNNQ